MCAQLSQQSTLNKPVSDHNFVQLLSTVRFLTRQALPLRGNLEENGNYWQLLKLLGQENDELGLWLNQARNITLHD